MKALIYFADPMCSWCWGFTPQIQKLGAYFSERLPIGLVMGGLRAGTSEPVDAKMKDYLRSAWTSVAERSGQPFDFSFLDRDGFVYDTEPACRAVVTIRDLAPENALTFFTSIQRAFYADGFDPTATDTLADLAVAAGVARDDFIAAFEGVPMALKTAEDFQLGQRIGVRGFPTLVASDENGLRLVSSGYREVEDLVPLLETWLGDAV
ncbi:MAG: DsbA family protein [Alphaproteobacteria bacterium]|nr:DsbA family protein [Alphaproteobacteria bacterium]